MPPPSNKDPNEDRPPDEEGRIAFWDFDEAATALEQLLLNGFTEEIEDAARRLLDVVDWMPTLTASQARRVKAMNDDPDGGPIPTDTWRDLMFRCRNILSGTDYPGTPSTEDA